MFCHIFIYTMFLAQALHHTKNGRGLNLPPPVGRGLKLRFLAEMDVHLLQLVTAAHWWPCFFFYS